MDPEQLGILSQYLLDKSLENTQQLPLLEFIGTPEEISERMKYQLTKTFLIKF
jgi:hypothetical protein